MSFGFSLLRKCCFVSHELGSCDLSPPFHGVKKIYDNSLFYPHSLGGLLPDSFSYMILLISFWGWFFQFCKSCWRSSLLAKSRLTKVCLAEISSKNQPCPYQLPVHFGIWSWESNLLWLLIPNKIFASELFSSMKGHPSWLLGMLQAAIFIALGKFNFHFKYISQYLSFASISTTWHKSSTQLHLDSIVFSPGLLDLP